MRDTLFLKYLGVSQHVSVCRSGGPTLLVCVCVSSLVYPPQTCTDPATAARL